MAPNKQYTQGRAIEYRVVQQLQERGLYACRTAGSHGPFDVIACDENTIMLVQVKSYRTKECPSYVDEIETLVDLPTPDKVSKFFVTHKIGSKDYDWLLVS